MSLNLFPQHDGAPSLPACDNLGTLLVLNPRPAMPIHLCLSALRAAPHQARVLVITSSRFSWRDALVELNDQALNKLASDAITAHMLSRIDVFNVPSKRHLDVLLVALSVLTPQTTVCGPYTLRRPPIMTLLLEPSHYVIGNRDASVSDYVHILANALATHRFLTSSCVSSESESNLIVLDSNVGGLQLPMIGRHHLEAEHARLPREARIESVLASAEKYFDVIATVRTDGEEEVESSGGLVTYAVSIRKPSVDAAERSFTSFSEQRR